MTVPADKTSPSEDDYVIDAREAEPCIKLNSSGVNDHFLIWSRGDELRFGSNAGVKAEASFYIDTGNAGDLYCNGQVIGKTTGDAFVGNVDGQVNDISNWTTDSLTEGTTNLYYTDTRARAAISPLGDLTYDNATGEIGYTHYNRGAAISGNADFGAYGASGKDDEVIQDISLTAEGHVSSIFKANLDDRYHPVGGDNDLNFTVKNLTVQGTTTTVNSSDVDIGDNIITLAANRPTNHTPSLDSGITIERGAEPDAHFHFDEGVDKWRLHEGTQGAGTVSTLIANIEGQVSDISNHTSLVQSISLAHTRSNLSASHAANTWGNLTYSNGVFTHTGITNAQIRGLLSTTNSSPGFGSIGYNQTTGNIHLSKVTSAQIRTCVTARHAGGYGSFTYNNSTGEFLHSGVDQQTIRGCIGASGALQYNAATGLMSYTPPPPPVPRTAGAGLKLSGNALAVDVDISTMEIANGKLKIGQNVHTSSNVQFSTVKAGSFDTTSDIALKSNITPVDSSLSKIQKLQAVSFNWKDSENKNKKLGMIANDVESVIPEVVNTDKDGLKAIDYSGVVSHLIEAVKTLSNKIDKLEKAS